MKKVTQIIMLLLMTAGFIFVADTTKEPEEVFVKTVRYEVPEISSDNLEIQVTPKVIVQEQKLSESEIELIALITMAEAEGECEEGQRLVIDTILNRVDSEAFPDNVYDVIYQKSQFSCVWNGRLDRVTVTEEMCQLVRDELKERTNSETIFFTAGGYGKYGNHMFSVGNHYFSSY